MDSQCPTSIPAQLPRPALTFPAALAELRVAVEEPDAEARAQRFRNSLAVIAELIERNKAHGTAPDPVIQFVARTIRDRWIEAYSSHPEQEAVVRAAVEMLGVRLDEMAVPKQRRQGPLGRRKYSWWKDRA